MGTHFVSTSTDDTPTNKMAEVQQVEILEEVVKQTEELILENVSEEIVKETTETIESKVETVEQTSVEDISEVEIIKQTEEVKEEIIVEKTEEETTFEEKTEETVEIVE